MPFVEVAKERKIFYQVHGKNATNTLLFVHGFAQTSHSFDDIFSVLSQDYRVIAIDLRGHGQSFWAPSEYSREAFVSDLRIICEKLNLDNFCLIGMSMGGAISTTFASVAPKELLRGLILIDWAPWPEDKAPEGVGKIAALFMHKWSSFDEAVRDVCRFNPRRTEENVRTRLKWSLMQNDDGTWGWNTDPSILGDANEKAKEPPKVMWERVRKIKAPSLIVHGQKSDVLSAEQAKRLASTLSDGMLVTVEGAGHSVVGDNPTGFIEAINPFLNRIHATHGSKL